MADERLNVGINFETTGNAEAVAALNALGAAATETAADFDAAAVAAKAMAEAQTGAQLLNQLGIKASAAGANAEGTGLVTVAASDQANAQSILNKAKLDAVAVTREEAAAILQSVAAKQADAVASERMASADEVAAAAKQRLALTEGEVALGIKAQNLSGAQSAIVGPFGPGPGGLGSIEEDAVGATGALSGMWTQLLLVIGALEAYQKAKEFVASGFEFNQTIESARLGIAATVNAMASLTDASGKTLEGQEKFGAATAIADDQINKLYADSVRTSTTVQQLVTIYQSAVAAGLNAGATLDQIRRLTTDAALTAGALNIPYSQLSVTLVQLLEGHTRITNRLSQELDITSADLKEWKEKGTLVENLLAKFGQFESLSGRVQGTWAGVLSNVKEFFQQLSGAATHEAFTTLEVGVRGQLARVFDFNTGKLGPEIQGAADLMREALGGGARLVVSLIEQMVNGLERLGTWFQQNRAEAEAMGRGFLEMVTNTGRVLASLISIGTQVTLWAAQNVVVQSVMRAIADIIGFIADHLGLIATMLAVGGGLAILPAILTAMVIPIPVLIAGFVALVAVLESFGVVADRAAAKRAAERTEMGEHAASVNGLVTQYRLLQREIDSGNLSAGDLARAKQQLKTVTEELVKISPAYKDALSSETESIAAKADAVERLNAAQQQDLILKRDAALAQNTADLARIHALEGQLTEATARRNALVGPASDAAGADVSRIETQLDQAKKAFNESDAEFHGFVTAIDKSMKAQDEAKRSVLASVHPNGKGDGEGAKEEKGIAEAEAAERIETLKAQVAAIKEGLDGQLKRNEISYADYFARLNATELTFFDAQIAEKRKLLADTKDPKEQAKLGRDIDKLQSEADQQVEKNLTKRNELEERYAKERTALAIQGLKDRGEVERAYDLQFEEQHRALRARAEAEDDQATLAELDRAYEIGRAKIAAEQAAVAARGVSSETQATVKTVQGGIDNGTINEKEGREAIIAAYEREKAAIGAALEAARALATTSPTVDNIAKVDALAKQYQAVDAQIVKVSDTSLHLRQQIAGALSKDLADFFTNTILHVHSVGDAFTQLAQTVLRSISQIIGSLLQMQAQKWILTLLTGAFGLAGAGAGAAASAAGNSAIAGSSFLSGLASGGHVTGPGGPTDDQIPAMLSNNEYVMPAHRVSQLGVSFFDAIKDGKLGISAHAYGGVVKFAGGGAVGSAPGTGPSPVHGASHIHVSVDPGLILETMRTAEGHKVTMETMQRNPKAARTALRLPG